MKYKYPLVAPKYDRVKQYLRLYELDGAIVSSPENIHYTAGFTGHQHTVTRQPGFSAAVLNSDPNSAVHITTMDFEFAAFEEKIKELRRSLGSSYTNIIPYSYHTWVGAKTWDEMLGIKNPAPLENSSQDSVLKDIVHGLNLENRRVGVELDYLNVNYLNKLKRMFPKMELVDISKMFIEARSVKTEDEILMFKTLCEVADEGFYKVSRAVRPGVTERDMAQVFRESVIASGVCAPSSWSMFSTGPASSRLSLPGDGVVAADHVFKFDAGVNAEFDFYTTDTSRAWVMPKADKELFRLKDRLYEAQRRMIEAAKPGLTFHELYHIAFDYVKKYYPSYERGHVGHSISIGPQTAEAPIISDGNCGYLKAGMVLAMEVPCYIKGFNGFNIEDMVLITKNGAEVLTPKTPHYL
ncbi:MAG: M24 family metallopeptidase [Christensenellales bacterium]